MGNVFFDWERDVLLWGLCQGFHSQEHPGQGGNFSLLWFLTLSPVWTLSPPAQGTLRKGCASPDLPSPQFSAFASRPAGEISTMFRGTILGSSEANTFEGDFHSV